MFGLITLIVVTYAIFGFAADGEQKMSWKDDDGLEVWLIGIHLK